MGNGKRWERELVRKLREHPTVGEERIVAERVPRSVADATPVDDIVCVPSFVEVADHPHRPITRALQRQQIKLDDITQVECKYKSRTAFGAATLLDKHLETVGLGRAVAVEWSGCNPPVYTGGLEAFAMSVEYAGIGNHWAEGDKPPKSATGLLDDADAAAIRIKGEPWVMVWR